MGKLKSNWFHKILGFVKQSEYVVGGIYGFAVWFFGSVIIMPTMLGMPIDIPDNPRNLVLGFFGPFIYGIILALVVAIYYDKMKSKEE